MVWVGRLGEYRGEEGAVVSMTAADPVSIVLGLAGCTSSRWYVNYELSWRHRTNRLNVVLIDATENHWSIELIQ